MRIVSFSKKLKVGHIPTVNTHLPKWIIFKRDGSGEIRLWLISFHSNENTTEPGHRLLKPRIVCQNLSWLPLEVQLMLVRLHPSLDSLFNISLDSKSPNLCLYKVSQRM